MLTRFLPTLGKVSWSDYIDRELLAVVCLIVGMGLVLMTSASLGVAEKKFGDPFYYMHRQLIFLALGVSLAILFYSLNLSVWEYLGALVLPIVLVLLVVVLIPGIGKEVNGSRRWIALGWFSIQVSEIAKLFMVVYLSGYLVRHGERLNDVPKVLAMPLGILAFTGFLLLLEPDFGASFVIMLTGLALLFLAGVKLERLGVLLLAVAFAMMLLIIMAPYRMQRFLTFLNPWADPLDSGYQLTHSLIAIGSGSLFGNGLGGSVQKLHYLPEAHNDFLFAVMAEELGLVGVVILLALFSWLVQRAFVIGVRADRMGFYFGGYLAYGIGFWFGIQVLVNLGVNMGLLPTKGLTLPLMSYGGSSLLVMMASIGLLMRVHRETVMTQVGKRVPSRSTGKRRNKVIPTKKANKTTRSQRVKTKGRRGRG